MRPNFQTLFCICLPVAPASDSPLLLLFVLCCVPPAAPIRGLLHADTACPPLKLDNTFLRTSDERVGEKGNISGSIIPFHWPRNRGADGLRRATVTPTAGRQEDMKRWTRRRTEGLQTVMDVHRRWATERNERMEIILEVTHTDGGAFSAVHQQKGL